MKSFVFLSPSYFPSLLRCTHRQKSLLQCRWEIQKSLAEKYGNLQQGNTVEKYSSRAGAAAAGPKGNPSDNEIFPRAAPSGGKGKKQEGGSTRGMWRLNRGQFSGKSEIRRVEEFHKFESFHFRTIFIVN
jgi:hypothetical protein